MSIFTRVSDNFWRKSKNSCALRAFTDSMDQRARDRTEILVSDENGMNEYFEWHKSSVRNAL